MMRVLVTAAALLTASACDKSDPASEDEKSKAAEAKAGDEDEVGAFTEYKRESIASEAKINLSRIATGVRVHYVNGQPGLDAAAQRTLPPAAPLTPAAGSCCKQPDGRCTSSADA